MTALDLVLTNLGPETAFGTGVKGPQKASEVYLRQNTRQKHMWKNMWRFECLKIISATKAAQAAMRRRGVAMAWIAGKLAWLFAIVSSRIRASVSACRLRPAPGLSRGSFHRNTRDSNNPTAFDCRFHAEIGNLPKLHRIKPSFFNTITTCMRPLGFLTAARKKKLLFP